MKKFLFVIIASALLVSGCNNSELDNSSSTVPQSGEILTNEQSTAVTSGSESNPESPKERESTVSIPISASMPEISESTSVSAPTSTNIQSSSSLTNQTNPVNSSSAESSASDPVFQSSTSNENTSNSSNAVESSVVTSSTVSLTSTIIPESLSTAANNSQANEPPADKEENTLSITITVNERKFSATLYGSETAKAFKALLPLTLDMSELNGNEKYYYLPDSLPRNSSRPSMINAGDIMLYGSDCLVIFYESFSTSYSYTPIGKIDDPDGLAAALGSANVQVTFN